MTQSEAIQAVREQAIVAAREAVGTLNRLEELKPEAKRTHWLLSSVLSGDCVEDIDL